MEILAAFLIAVGPFALGCTKVVDFVRTQFDTNDTWNPSLWILLSFLVGVGMALLTGLNLVGTIDALSPHVANHLTGVWGQVVTGFAVGGTSAYWHAHLSQKSAKTQESLAIAESNTPTATQG